MSDSKETHTLESIAAKVVRALLKVKSVDKGKDPNIDDSSKKPRKQIPNAET